MSNIAIQVLKEEFDRRCDESEDITMELIHAHDDLVSAKEAYDKVNEYHTKEMGIIRDLRQAIDALS